MESYNIDFSSAKVDESLPAPAPTGKPIEHRSLLVEGRSFGLPTANADCPATNAMGHQKKNECAR
jgi:hypothetical protein